MTTPLRQAGAIPFRVAEVDGVEFLVITSKKGNWIFPKGIVEDGETAAEAAVKETREEAGIRGDVVGSPIGTYTYSKWEQDILVEMFLLRYQEEAESWEEASFRDRRWCSYEEARELLKKESLRKLLDAARKRLPAE